AAAYFTVFSLATLAAFDYRFALPFLKIVVALMFLMTLWLLYLQAVVIRHFCQYCLLSAAVTTALTAVVFLPSLLKKRARPAN
ncbi:MAG TPA: vitamin K epoxide reductase family protein, partial [Pyrinomonadaceae bacterium]|nr:vitamin K epoxide reductase family protein [Pyrinomonadaceae bacterium]